MLIIIIITIIIIINIVGQQSVLHAHSHALSERD